MAITRVEGQDGSKMTVNADGSIDVNVKGLESPPIDTSMNGMKVKMSWEGNTTETKSIGSGATGISVVNDGEDDLTISVNGMGIKVKPNEVFDSEFEEFTQVTITTTGAYRALVKG